MGTGIDKKIKLLSKNLDDVQGHILKSHGRKRVWCVFFKFLGSPANSREWVAKYANKITSVKGQQLNSANRKKGIDNITHVNFYLSAAGYRKLGFSTDDMPADRAFRFGMKSGQVNVPLSDPITSRWESGYRERIDGMVLLANNYENKLHKELMNLYVQLSSSGVGMPLFVEKGNNIHYSGSKKPIEHFGFKDGIINPKFQDEQGHYNQNIDIALDENLGSYLVFRKLEQNVFEFNRQVERIASALQLKPVQKRDLDFVAAQIIGRHKNGKRLDLGLDKSEYMTSKEYSFQEDSEGERCPFHAHIRKVRPRVEPFDVEMANGNKKLIDPEKKIIVRRGITYGNRAPDLSDEPREGVGLLFMCFQKNITQQFEHIQINWCNNKDFISPDISRDRVTGVDPIIGQTSDIYGTQHWKARADKGESTRRKFQKVVKMKGGEYFYAPPKSLLKEIDNVFGEIRKRHSKEVGRAPMRRRRRNSYGFTGIGLSSAY